MLGIWGANMIAPHKEIKYAVAQIMAWHGANPEVLCQKLEELVLQWFKKGLNSKI